MKEIKFNWIVPHEFKDPNSNEIKYAICRGNEKMNVDTLKFIQNGYANPEKPKNAQPWGQVFSNGFRVVTESLNFAEWNGITFSDVDSKWYYKCVKAFDAEELLRLIAKLAPMYFGSNFYACHLTNSKQGYRIFWYWDCERTEENFKKCCIMTEKCTRELFYSFGKKATEIIDFDDGNGHRTLDRCSNSIMQGFYVTSNQIFYSNKTDEEDYGFVDLSDISLEQVYQISNVVKTGENFDQRKCCKCNKVNEPNKQDIKYYPHSHRRCIYEALCMLYDGNELADQWKRISLLLPEGNGHNAKFYESEPTKNRWYERINKNVFHDLSWLKEFGYEYADKTEYIYVNQFKKSWKKHIIAELKKQYVSLRINEYEQSNWSKLKKDEQNMLIDSWYKEAPNDVFDKWWDSNLSSKDEYKAKLDLLRAQYWNTRWKKEDFKYLCDGYQIPNDIVTYKMYADFYYRDDSNLPTIKYNVLEDDVMTYGYWAETDKKQWHTFKYGNEYTHWKNSDTFSNKCTKTDLNEAINKFATRWFGYHEIKDYLNGLDLSKADEELLETWAIRYLKANDTPLVRTISKNFFIAAVKKQMIEDPTKFVFQHLLFLYGKTGCGKTAFITTMFTINSKSYILNKVDPNAKDNELGPLIAKNWVIQFGENEGIGNLKKVSVNAAKEFVDRINLGMKYQKKYENEQTTIYPRIVACKTTNDDILFNDISVGVDRRNWLIELNVPEDYWNDELQKKLEAEKDILWATAYKLYLDNPNMSLELSSELFKELGNVQEKHKMITDNDIDEVYDELFERYYNTNSKGFIMDEVSFDEQVKRSDELLTENLALSDSEIDILGVKQEYELKPAGYSYKMHIKCLPVKWVKNYITSKYGINTYGSFHSDSKLDKYNLEVKNMRYNNVIIKCFAKK